ncbi:phosphopantetheine-binding protein [Actinomadura madurae]|uniref:phosphopantetheine-binding protein n=1 Tax=Actinomadura madurae TaxID=1993 RepID=UPI0020D1F632|nr:phosphopantetheine-binding protein [Actinomadura madurae]MCQ0015269.1 phosphopantetheine-binding protein [Actinomadura madurae]
MTDLAHSAPAGRQVLEIIASNTLYDVSQLRPESHLEGELGVDAAVLDAILGDVRDRFGPDVRLPREAATPQDLIDAVERSLAAAAPGPAAPDGPSDGGPDGARLAEAVMTAAMRHTHYRRDQLDLDAELEAELGIDSVVLASIITDAAEDLGLSGPAPELTVPNLRALIAELRDRAAGDAPRPEPAPEAPAPAGSGPRELAVGELDPVRPAPSTAWDDRSMRDFMDDRDPDLFAKARGFASYLRGREAEHLYWYGMPLRSRCANRARIHDELTGRTREFLMFASNNYLGLANHPRVIDAVCEATRTYGATNTGCRIIGGTNHLHKELERRSPRSSAGPPASSTRAATRPTSARRPRWSRATTR